MKKTRMIAMALLAIAILLTGCPGPNDTEVPKGKFEISLSEEVVASFSENHYVTVQIYPNGDSSNIVREVKLTKASPSAFVDVTPGTYGLRISYVSDIRLGLDSSSVTISDNGTASVKVIKKDSGKLKLVFDEESKAIIKSLSKDEKLTLALNSDNGKHTISFGSAYNVNGYNVAPGTYSVSLSSGINGVNAHVSESSVTIEKDQVTELGISLYAEGSLYINLQNVKDQNIDVTVEITKDEEVVRTVSDSEQIKLPVGEYKLSISTDMEKVALTLDNDTVVIERGGYNTVTASVKKNGTVLIRPSSELISAIGDGEAKVSFIQNGIVKHTYSLSAKSEREFDLPEGTYTVEIESPEGAGIRFTVMDPVLNVSYGTTAAVELAVETVETFKLNITQEELSLLKDSEVILCFKKGSEIQEFSITKDLTDTEFEIVTGIYNVYCKCDDPKLQPILDTNRIVIDGEDDVLSMTITQMGAVIIEWNVVGDLGGNSFTLEIKNDSFTRAVDFTKNQKNRIVSYIPVGEYTVSFDNDPEKIAVKTEGIPEDDKVIVTYDTDLIWTITATTGGSFSGNISNDMTGDLDFDIVKGIALDDDEKPYDVLKVVGDSIPASATVIWYDTSASYEEGQLEQYVGHEKALSILPDKLEHIEVRIYIDDELRASKKIDMSIFAEETKE